MGKGGAKDAAAEAARKEALRKDIDFVEHTWEASKVYEHFGTHPENGLTAQGVKDNREKYGENRLTPPPVTPAWLKFLMQFTNFFALLLLAGGTLCFVGYGLSQEDPTNLYLGVVLYLVVLITATFSFLQEAKSEKIMEGFKNMIPKKCKVYRDGSLTTIDAWEIVPGDLVELHDGDQVPADIRVMSCNELKVDNSSLTGESEPQDRTPDLSYDSAGNLVTQPLEAVNLCFYTTIINAGSGKGIAIGTGDRTVMGQIAGLATETSNESSPIAREIEKFIHLISAVAIVLGVVIFITAMVMYPGEPIKNVVLMIGIIVANVPEGLLATVTVSLALTAQRMHSKNVLVKNLEAVETLGSTTVIASDKTGTLTQNRMTVQHCWYDGKIVSTPAARNIPHYQELFAAAEPSSVFDINAPTFKKLSMVLMLCNNAKFLLVQPDESVIDLKSKMGDPTFNLLKIDCSGDASESGLVKLAESMTHVEDFRAKYPKVFEIKFNSLNKWQLSIHSQPDKSNNVMVLKGAPERVLTKCKYIMVNGEKVPLNKKLEEEYTTAYEELGGMGERVLGFAYKECDEPAGFEYVNKPEPNFPTDDLVFVGLFSLIDPPREGVPEAVAKCKRACIKVFMVTGDHPITARAIAKQVGIIDQEKFDAGKATVVKGDDIRDWMDLTDKVAQQAKWDEALSHEQIVWARVSPAHKLLIVENCQRRGEIVAVTGDGVNDAPALKKGDIGIAMGIAGKDVSKEAADMILMDDNFASIVNGVEEGRLIFDNLKKSIAYTLTSNIPEIGPFLCFIILQIPLPLSTVLILCVDLGTDMVPAISLAYEEKEADIMNRPPRNAATDRLVNRRLISFAYLQIGVIQALAGFYCYMTVLNDYGYAPRILIGNGFDWEYYSLMCTSDGYGRPKECGYGCKDIDEKFGLAEEFCEGGCKIPDIGNNDPFLESTSDGFRGFDLGNPCDRSCAWYMDNMDSEAITPTDAVQFEALCADYIASPDEATNWGFPGRDKVNDSAEAPPGAFYWWDGKGQKWPNTKYQKEALAYAQTSYFISIIVVQWADLIIAKTRKLSVFEQGLGNKFMNFGLLFETVLGATLCYTKVFNTVFNTRPIHLLHWFPGVPWSMYIFIYDEIRKSLMRQNPNGWLDRFTYW